jgi:hypothetical protein
LGRFFISYYRVNNIIFLGMREAQLLALAGIILVPIAAYILRRRARSRTAGVIGKNVGRKGDRRTTPRRRK